mmetsp:Transcript_22866/g.33995  ORF Transcript_22866/g.33995 Transcript_22866/m.33995 type:complete len:96 (-) Transcript_22866:199-486(-)
MPGVNSERRSRVRQATSRGKTSPSRPSRQRQPDSSISPSRSQMPPSARRSEEHDTSTANDKINELKNEISEIYDFYGYDATLYYVLSTTDRCSEI